MPRSTLTWQQIQVAFPVLSLQCWPVWSSPGSGRVVVRTGTLMRCRIGHQKSPVRWTKVWSAGEVAQLAQASFQVLANRFSPPWPQPPCSPCPSPSRLLAHGEQTLRRHRPHCWTCEAAKMNFVVWLRDHTTCLAADQFDGIPLLGSHLLPEQVPSCQNHLLLILPRETLTSGDQHNLSHVSL